MAFTDIDQIDGGHVVLTIHIRQMYETRLCSALVDAWSLTAVNTVMSNDSSGTVASGVVPSLHCDLEGSWGQQLARAN